MCQVIDILSNCCCAAVPNTTAKQYRLRHSSHRNGRSRDELNPFPSRSPILRWGQSKKTHSPVRPALGARFCDFPRYGADICLRTGSHNETSELKYEIFAELPTARPRNISRYSTRRLCSEATKSGRLSISADAPGPCEKTGIQHHGLSPKAHRLCHLI